MAIGKVLSVPIIASAVLQNVVPPVSQPVRYRGIYSTAHLALGQAQQLSLDGTRGKAVGHWQ
jgi:hypothetical protein